MKPWDDPKTVARFRRMSGARSVEIASDFIEASLELLKESIRAQHPRWSWRRQQQEIERILWAMGHGV